MPKLNKTLATATAEAESTGFEPLPEGVYDVALRDVEVKEGQKAPYWLWTFEVPTDASEHAGRRLWLNTSLSENALWKLNETFGAFGQTPDTDTDTLLGKRVRAVVVQRTIQAGARAGETTNQIDKLLPAAEPAKTNGKTTAAGKENFTF